MKQEHQVVAVKYTNAQLHAIVTLAERWGTGVVEITVPTSQARAYPVGRRVTLEVTPR